MRNKLRILFTGTLMAAMLPLAAPVAAAGTNSVQARVDAVLAEFGGVQITANQVSFDGGRAVLTLESGTIAPLAVKSCATGTFCAYNLTNQGGAKLAFTDCKATNSTAPLGQVRSVANARSSGTVKAYNGATAVLSVAAGKAANTGASITRLGC